MEKQFGNLSVGVGRLNHAAEKRNLGRNTEMANSEQPTAAFQLDRRARLALLLDQITRLIDYGDHLIEQKEQIIQDLTERLKAAEPSLNPKPGEKP